MTCQHVTLPDGTGAIVCGSRSAPRCACGRLADRLCDWKVPERRSGTCDKPVCHTCSAKPAKDKDLCPEHAIAFRAWQRDQQRKDL